MIGTVLVLVALSACGTRNIPEGTVGVYRSVDDVISQKELPAGSDVAIGFGKPGVALVVTDTIEVVITFLAVGQDGTVYPRSSVTAKYRIDPNLAAEYIISGDAKNSGSERLKTYAGSVLVGNMLEVIIERDKGLIVDALTAERFEDIRSRLDSIRSTLEDSLNEDGRYFSVEVVALSIGQKVFENTAGHDEGFPTKLRSESIDKEALAREPSTFWSVVMPLLGFGIAIIVFVRFFDIKIGGNAARAGRDQRYNAARPVRYQGYVEPLTEGLDEYTRSGADSIAQRRRTARLQNAIRAAAEVPMDPEPLTPGRTDDGPDNSPDVVKNFRRIDLTDSGESNAGP